MIILDCIVLFKKILNVFLSKSKWVHTSTQKKMKIEPKKTTCQQKITPPIFHSEKKVHPHCAPPIPTPVVVPRHLDVPAERRWAVPPAIEWRFPRGQPPPVFFKGWFLIDVASSWRCDAKMYLITFICFLVFFKLEKWMAFDPPVLF